MKKALLVFSILLTLLFFGCENSINSKKTDIPDTQEPDDFETQTDNDSDTPETADDTDTQEIPDEELPDTNDGENQETPDDTETDNEPLPCNENDDPVFCYGKYYVNTIDVFPGDNGASRQFRIFEPINAQGNIPVIHFLHGYQLKCDYYDGILMHLASHGFIVVSSQSNHATDITHPNNSTSATEAANVAEFITWLKTNLSNYVSVTPDFDNFGVSGHNRGGKTTNRLLNSDPALAKSFFGVDPTDVDVDIATLEDPSSLNDPVLFTGNSMFLGVEKRKSLVELSRAESLCAFEDDDSGKFYAAYPSPSRHIVAAGVGRTDMLDLGECGSTCTLSCSSSGDDGMNAMFITYTAGLMTAFFNSTLKGQTEYETLLNDPKDAYPFTTTLVEHK